MTKIVNHRFFGTDGIRGKVGGPCINQNFAYSLGLAIGSFLARKDEHGGTVLIGRDTRSSGEELASAIASGLFNSGFSPMLAGVLPTPALAHALVVNEMRFGIMVTASHNPAPDNGFKLFDHMGRKLSKDQEWLVEEHILGDSQVQVANEGLSVKSFPHLDTLPSYRDHILGILPENALSDFRIVADLSNGATTVTTPEILRELGAEVITIADGEGAINHKVGSEHPKVLAEKVKATQANIGLAHDGDGDRVILCDDQGKVVHGDKLLGLLALHAKRTGKLSGNVLVATVQSNSGLERSLNNLDVRLARSEVGDRNVAELMRELGGNLGGESSGHIIASDHLPSGDGLLSFLLASQAMLETDSPLSVLADEIDLAPCIENAYRVLEKTPLESLPELLEIVTREEQSLGKEGRVLLRYSGTELKIRLLVEALASNQAEEVFLTLEQALRKALRFA
jgi:phosphoglucosamine mutase